MSDRFSNRHSNGERRPIQRRDPAEIEAHLRHRERGAIEEHLRNRDRTAANRERVVHEAQSRSRERSAILETRAQRAKSRQRHRRTAIVLASLISALLVAAVVVPPVAAAVFRTLAEANPDLLRVGLIADAVGADMGDRPDRPAGRDPTPVEFEIEPGTSSREITEALVERELVTDPLAFMYVLVTDGGIDELRAGIHSLNRTMSPREVATALQQPPFGGGGGGVPVALRQGLRIEQVVAYLQTLPLDNLDVEQFHALASDPPDWLRDDFEWLRVIPEGRSVEGFLGSGSFEVAADIDAEAMLALLLQRWEDSPSYTVIADAEARGIDFYDVVTLASIVEREAALDREKPLIAGVFQNRLDGVGEGRNLLQSDSALIYAKDTMQLRELPLVEWPEFVFWTFDGLPDPQSFETAADLTGFQTWRTRGLPPGPIATPSLSSIEATMNPDTDDGYLYFLSKLDGSREHVFARTYEEHLRNIDIYLRGESPVPSALPTAVPLPSDARQSPEALTT